MLIISISYYLFTAFFFNKPFINKYIAFKGSLSIN